MASTTELMKSAVADFLNASEKTICLISVGSCKKDFLRYGKAGMIVEFRRKSYKGSFVYRIELVNGKCEVTGTKKKGEMEFQPVDLN